jgi:hypothetical protein
MAEADIFRRDTPIHNGLLCDLAHIWHALKNAASDLPRDLLPRVDSNHQPFG